MQSPLRILVKFPTRGRATLFERVLRQYEAFSSGVEINYLVTLDSDDPQAAAYTAIINRAVAAGIPVKGVFGNGTGKIAACNRDMPSSAWDIVVLASDDMIPQQRAWDTTLRDEMIAHYPDLDGVLFHNDGYLKARLNTMCILGRKYYARFGYIYHPSYKSLWCDNEFTFVAARLKKQTYFDTCLFKHEHYSNNPAVKIDPSMRHNQAFYKEDKKNFEVRQARGFPSVYSQNDKQQIIETFFQREPQDALTCLDIGANDGVTLSNTRACIERGWRALLVEPSPTCVQRLRATYDGNDRVFVMPRAVAATEGEVTLWESGSHLTAADHSLVSSLRKEETARWQKEKFSPIAVEAVRFSALRAFAATHSLAAFDLISIDIEGLDYEVLEQIDLRAVGCRMLIVEVRSGDETRFVDYCARHEMIVKVRNFENLIFVRS